jgi:cytochrome o ubiquinol oxidase operon protein cyoD
VSAHGDHPHPSAAAQKAPGDEGIDEEVGGGSGIRGYLIGLGLAVFLTCASFYMAHTPLVWGPAIPIALLALAVAQMGVHLVFFLHLSTGADNTNNVLALAFGVLIVVLVVAGSLWIMWHLNQNMLPMPQIMQMQR